MQNHKKWRGGFTLIEILVVLAVVAIISSISFGAFRSVSEGNKRTNCQSNLSQIYKSARLYAQDNEGRFPYLNAGVAPSPPSPQPDNTPQGGIGLWSLYAFPTDTINPNNALCPPPNANYSQNLNLPRASDDGVQQLAGYVKSPKIFHCPADRFNRDIKLRTLDAPAACVTQNAPTASLTIKVAGVDAPYLNPAYLSYQNVDDVGTTPRDTYSSFRQPTAPVRQLTPYIVTSGVTSTLDRPTRDMTVLTWCRFHRSLNNTTGDTVTGQRNFDNVLFSDGSVQSLPAEQKVTNTPGGTETSCYGWQRVPRDKAESMESASNCTPKP